MVTEKRRKETDQVLTEKPPVLLEQQQKNWADQGLGWEKRGGGEIKDEQKKRKGKEKEKEMKE